MLEYRKSWIRFVSRNCHYLVYSPPQINCNSLAIAADFFPNKRANVFEIRVQAAFVWTDRQTRLLFVITPLNELWIRVKGLARWFLSKLFFPSTKSLFRKKFNSRLRSFFLFQLGSVIIIFLWLCIILISVWLFPTRAKLLTCYALCGELGHMYDCSRRGIGFLKKVKFYSKYRQDRWRTVS